MDEEDPGLSAALSAWSAPPAPSGMADRVIARVNTTDHAIAVTQRRRAKRRWWLAGGLAAALAAAAVALVVIPHGTTPEGESAGSGTTVATRPQQLALAGAIANLDPGADVSWQESAGSIHVEQRGGAATWRVDKSHLFLDVGAAVASIEASNATLRVETRMNISDARVIGAAAVTSAAVALVTVIVYEGHVKLSSAGQTVVVQPGMTYEVAPGKPPKVEIRLGDEPADHRNEVTMNVGGEPLEDAPELVIKLGEKVTVHDPRGAVSIAVDKQCASDPTPMYPNGANELTEVGEYNFSYTCDGIAKRGTLNLVQDGGIGVLSAPFENTVWTKRVHVAGTPVPARAQVTIDGVPIATDNNQPWSADVTPATPNFIAVRIDAGLDDVNYYIRRGASAPDEPTDKTTAKVISPEQIVHGLKWGALSGDAIDDVMAAAEPTMIKCIRKRADGQMLMFDILPDGTVTKLTVTIDDPSSEACVAQVMKQVHFPRANASSRVSYSLAPSCNPEELRMEGTGAVSIGDNVTALKKYEAALHCKYDVHTLQLTFMAACRAGNVVAARRHWRTMDANMKVHLLQMCLQKHITQDMLDR